MTSLLSTHQLDIVIGQTHVCHQLDWRVHPREVWGVLGINGAGKTTLLNSLIGLHKANAGDIVIDEKPLISYGANQLAKKVGYLFQHFDDSFPITVFDYCSNALHPQMNRWKNLSSKDLQLINSTLEKVGLSNFEKRLTNTLSGGEKRRVEIASLLIQKPNIWLLDEPVNHLDIHYQITMMELLINTAQENNGAVISVLHDANIALRFCTHILLLMNNGEHLLGPSEKLLTKEHLSNLYQHNIHVLNDHGKIAFLAD